MITEKTIRKQIRLHSDQSFSQLHQDVLVLALTNFKEYGYFIEFGAADGIKFSNSYLLESKYNWSGVCAEPIPSQFKKLVENRACSVDPRVVYNTTGSFVNFKINEISLDESKIVTDLDDGDISVETVTLVDLVREYNAPKEIDYMSIDTEGTEYEIISNFDFLNYDVKIITIEHNYNEENRMKIYSHLVPLGYKRILTDKSQWDDWYVKSELLESFDESIYYPSEE